VRERERDERERERDERESERESVCERERETRERVRERVCEREREGGGARTGKTRVASPECTPAFSTCSDIAKFTILPSTATAS